MADALREVVRVESGGGATLYVLPVTAFPGHVTNAVLVDHPEYRLLFDLGTASALTELERRMEEARDRFGLRTTLDDLDLVLFSHGHTDHFGGAHALAARGVPLAIHTLDARVLEHAEERRQLFRRDLRACLRRAGVGEVERLAALYGSLKQPFADLPVDRRVRHGERIGPGWEVLHTPGHHPGLICLQVDEVVLTGDHLLEGITPVQQPASLVPGCGVGAYLSSLRLLEQAGPFALGIGAHGGLIPDVALRIRQTRAHHLARLRRTRAACEARALTVSEVAGALFGSPPGYGAILAVLEAGAHVELLHQLGALAVENLDGLDDPDHTPRFRAVSDAPLEPC
ncbi:MAG: MBL fold metallo-hydrolase [Deltaproteobacteria bacterium]|nr:MBL fold metallo-hydrolase [Deltaproteobacteria bacterium]